MNNKPKTKLLTISLLCCGRADTTERCLKSLMPIRNAIDSELQVVDTGCSPETRAIVEKYADEVFDFEWINDFAAARNFQLDQANGKMLLFIDDDEFFLDCKYIIEFFKQPDCTDYNIGGYYQRNYTDLEGKEYEDIEVVRMCTITPETVFKGKVHEYIEPSYGNAMFMDARAGHYGYVYMTDEDNYNHAMRNIPLLLEMMEEEPDNLRWPYQLGQEYRSIKKFDELYDLCKEAFDHSFDIHEPESIRYRGPFICGMLITLDAQARYDEVIELYNDQINKNDIMDVPKAKMCVYAAKAYFVKGNDDKCEELVDYYFKTRERYEEDKGQMFVQGGIFVSDVFDSFHLNTMYCYKMTCAMHRDDLGPLVHYYRRIAWNNHVVRINRGFVHTLAMKAAKYGPKKEITDVLNKFFVRPGLRDIMEKEIEDALPVLNEEQLENIKKAFAKTDGKKEMDMFLDIRIMERYLAAHYQDYATFGELYDIIAQYANTVLDWNEHHRQWLENGKTPPMAKEVLLAKGLVQFSQFVDTNVKGAFTSLKGALGNRQLMDEPINQLSKLYGEYQKVLNAKKTEPQKFEEMYNLEEALLAQISELDAAGKSDEAIATYQQLEQILQQTFGVSTLHQ